MKKVRTRSRGQSSVLHRAEEQVFPLQKPRSKGKVGLKEEDKSVESIKHAMSM